MKTAFHARRIGWPRAAALILVVAAMTPAPSGCRQPVVVKVSSIPVQGVGRAVLEDLCGNDMVLLDAIGTAGEHPSLRLWDLKRAKLALEVPMDAWVEHRSALNNADLPRWDGPFRCLDGGRRVVAMQGNYLALIDMGKREEVKRVLPSSDLNNMASPFAKVMWKLTHRTLEVSPDQRLIAAAYNWGTRPRVFLYAADLRRVARSWELPRYLQDICWSPDGQKLAVLYSGLFDANYTFVGTSPGFRLTGIPDVEVFDVSSGKSLLRFFSAGMEARIAFSPDGAHLYTISGGRYGMSTGKVAAVRTFSGRDGTLVRTIAFPRYKLHNNFAVSPDGKLIVADASTPAPYFFFKEMFAEGAFYRKHARFVIADAQTGRLLFTHDEITGGETVDLLCFAFSRDGSRLLVDPDNPWASEEFVEVYSLDALRCAAFPAWCKEHGLPP